MILAIFDLQVARYFLPNFESIGLSIQRKKRKVDFQDGTHLRFLTGMILTIFDLQVASILPFMSNGLSVQEKKSRTDFKHGSHLGFRLERF